jgi:ZIP family zinc transporter
MDPALTVLLWATVAALASVPGGLVRRSSGEPGAPWVGWAHALAAGGMLGAAYALTAVREVPAGAAAVGGAFGVGFIVASHSLTGVGRVDYSRPDVADPGSGFRLLLIHMLHASSEGIAIGVAMAADLSLGVFMALAIAVHNVPEAAVLAAATGRLGFGRRGTVALAVLSNAGQPLLALATWVVIAALPAALPWILGFAVGALLNLVLTELLPASYREAGSTSIALVASVALGLVVLLSGVLP